VIVVGAGPAGSSTARYAAAAGLRTLLLDRREEIGYPVQCGEYLPTLEEMERLVPLARRQEELFTLPEDDVVALRTHVIEVISPKGRVYPVPFEGYTLQRRAFDKWVAQRAVDEGAELWTETYAWRLRQGKLLTSEGELSAKVYVGADGPFSRIARSAGLPRPAATYPAVTFQARGDLGEKVLMYFGDVAPGGYAWVIPKRGGANVGLGIQRELDPTAPSKLLLRWLDKTPWKDRYDPESLTMGNVPMSGPVARTVKGNVLTVGDAAGHVMATNGGGIPIALLCGREAGRAVAAHLLEGRPLEAYEEAWRSIVGRLLAEGVKIKRLADRFWKHPWWLEQAMRLLGRRGANRAIRCQPLFFGS